MARVLSIAGLLAALTAGGCAAEPAAAPNAPATAGGEAQTSPPPARGNVASAQMAVEPREPGPPVDPATVSSEPSALVRQPQAQPAPAAAAQAPTYVTTPPPAPRPESYPTETSVDWVWAPGYWYWYGGHYEWISGAWIPARRGHVYVSARWVQSGRGWMFVPGGWALSTYDPIVYPVYPYDPFYYRDYHDHWHHHGYGRRNYYQPDRLRVRPGGRPDRARPSSRLRVRAR